MLFNFNLLSITRYNFLITTTFKHSEEREGERGRWLEGEGEGEREN